MVRGTVFFALILQLGEAMASSPETALHRGFPIYPAEAVDGVAPDAVLVETKSIEGKSVEAADLVEKRAVSAGWDLVRRREAQRGGAVMLFAQRHGERFELVYAHFPEPKIAIVKEKRRTSGKWFYRFLSTTPVSFRGFPLCHQPREGVAPLRRTPKQVSVGCAPGPVVDDELEDLRIVAGWKLVSEGRDTAVYEKDDTRVRVESLFSPRGRTRRATLVSEGG